MGGDLPQRLVPDDPWAWVEPVLPSFRSRPQGGGTAPVGQRAVFTAVVYVPTSGCAWRYLPPAFGLSSATAHRRFSIWTASGVRRRLHRVILDEIGAHSGLDWSSVIVDAVSVRAKGSAGGAESGRPGQSRQQTTRSDGSAEAAPGVGVSAANVNDVQALGPLVPGIPAIRSRRDPRRRRPEKVRADKAYHSAGNLTWLRERNITPRIARPGVEHSERFRRHRWKIQRSISRLFGYRRLAVRHERKGSHFLGLAAAMTYYKKLAKVTT
ncbi:IS5 family transposase [Streptomyces omiyaensis]|uniref:IS5 family transposase n=1 Tax=Streptomyces omiyaensis TaxID=68247 RepID=UPI0036FA8DED